MENFPYKKSLTHHRKSRVDKEKFSAFVFYFTKWYLKAKKSNLILKHALKIVKSIDKILKINETFFKHENGNFALSKF